MATTTLQPREQTAVEKAPERQWTNLEQALWSKRFAADLAHFLGSPEAAASLIAEIFNQARHVPGLHQCTIDSIRLNVARIAALRLNPALPNMVHFIPREITQADKRTRTMELTIQYGYAGLRALVMRSPEVNDCFTRAVCANDHFEPPATLTGPPIHRLPGGFQPRGPVRGYFAVVELHNGHWRFWPMSVAEIETHVQRFIKKPGPAWSKAERPDEEGLTPRDKMSLKTCLRMLCNGRDVPMSPEVREALDAEVEAERTPTAAEHQGYDRQGQRPAISMQMGVPMEDLLQDVSGTRDREAIEVRIQEETRPQTARVVPELTPERASGTNGSWRDNVAALIAALPDALTPETPAALVRQVEDACAQASRVVEAADTPTPAGAAMLETLKNLQDKLAGQLSLLQGEWKV